MGMNDYIDGYEDAKGEMEPYRTALAELVRLEDEHKQEDPEDWDDWQDRYEKAWAKARRLVGEGT